MRKAVGDYDAHDYYTIDLNKREVVKDVIEADEEEGYYVSHDRDEQGEIRIFKGEIVKKKVYTKVFLIKRGQFKA